MGVKQSFSNFSRHEWFHVAVVVAVAVIECDRYPMSSMDADRCPWMSMGIHTFPCRCQIISMDILANPELWMSSGAEQQFVLLAEPFGR
jgi:hypothetical protein